MKRESFVILMAMLCLISTVSTALAGFQSSVVIELNVTAGEWDDSVPVEEQLMQMQVEPFEHIASGEGRIVIGPAREDGQNFNNPAISSSSGGGDEKGAHHIGSGENGK